eukprot:TRINITY_DN5107_c5_g1_i1.p1 TRINITY_DN5107_c5_g1~~TRINITY_DN5107_c5_g1_i1.p1  ORF type:complete len:264 (+),score=52.13 TRINITY_DN5107_c5_g1_i1:58-849(+)
MAQVAADPVPVSAAAGAGFNAVLHRTADPSGLPGGPEDDELWGKSLREVYEASCERHGCKANTAVVRLLPADWSARHRLHRLDLSLNFIGRVGLRPVLDVVRRSPQLQHLSLADNFLDNSAVAEVLATVDGHPSLRTLDLSRNPVSQAAGKLLSSLVRNNANISSVIVDDTLISPALKASILRKAAANYALSEEEERELRRRQAAVREAQRLQQIRRQRRQGYTRPRLADGADPIDTLLAFSADHDPGGSEHAALATLLSCFE